MRPKLLGLVLFAAVAALPGFAQGLLVSPGQWEPFLERLEKDEFLAAEHAIGGTLSDGKPDLLIYRAGGKEIGTSVAFFRRTGQSYRLEVVFNNRGGPGPVSKTIGLPAATGERLLAVMQLCLTKKLFAPTGQAYLYPNNRGEFGAYWLNLRVDDSTSIAGVVLTERCMTGRDSAILFLDVIYRLTSLAEPERSETALADLESAISSLQNAYLPKH